MNTDQFLAAAAEAREARRHPDLQTALATLWAELAALAADATPPHPYPADCPAVLRLAEARRAGEAAVGHATLELGVGWELDPTGVPLAIAIPPIDVYDCRLTLPHGDEDGSPVREYFYLYLWAGSPTAWLAHYGCDAEVKELYAMELLAAIEAAIDHSKLPWAAGRAAC